MQKPTTVLEAQTMSATDNNYNSNNAAATSLDHVQKPLTGTMDAASNNNNESTLTKINSKIKQFRNRVGYLVNHPYVQGVIISFIAINAIMLGIATYSFVQDSEYISNIFDTTDYIFLIIFTVELILQFIYLGLIPLLKDPWLVFDVLLIGSSWIFEDVTIIRSFRIFRTLRLISRISVMRNLIVALFSVVPRMIAILVLLMLISYIFAVMMTQLFQNLYKPGNEHYESDSVNYFGRLDYTYLTLFQIMTLDNWSEVSTDVTNTFSWGWLPIIVYMIIAGFIIFNLIIAVVCDAISALQEDTKAKLHGTYDKDKEYNTDAAHSNSEIDNIVHHTIPDEEPNPLKLPNIDESNIDSSSIRRRNNNTFTIDKQADENIGNIVRSDTTNNYNLSSKKLPVRLQHDSNNNNSNMNDQLQKLQQQMLDMIKVQDQTIQHVISVTQQYQSIRCTTNNNTAPIIISGSK